MNSTFVKDVQSDESLEAFSNYFTKFDELHDYLTAHSSRNCVTMEHSRTQFYSSFSIRNKAASLWNFLKRKLNTNVTSQSHNKAKQMLMLYFLSSYKDQ